MNMAFKAFLLGMATYPLVSAAQTHTDSCDAKRRSIENEISYAHAHGDVKRIKGLETALAQINANCTDAGLRSDAQRKVAAAEKKLAERERDLQDAKANGKRTKKIAEKQRKVDEAHAELEQAQMEAARRSGAAKQ